MDRQPIGRRSPWVSGMLLAAATVFSLGQVSSATARNWIGLDGDWSPGNWSSAGPPVLGEAVNIVHTDGTARTIKYNVTAPSLGLLCVDLTGADTTTDLLSLASNFSLQAHGLFIGGYNGVGQTNGRGEFDQLAGTVTLNSSDLAVGYGPGSTGVYTLGGTGTLVAGQSEYIALSGTGTFTQSAGSNSITTATGFFEVGTSAGSVGTYNLSGTGSLVSNTTEYIGDIGTGVFNQIGGTNTLVGNIQLYLGFNSSGSGGTYNLSAGVLSAAGNEIVGHKATGCRFNQLGGTNSVGATLQIGGHAGSVGTYTQSGGVLNVVNSPYGEYVGIEGTGTFNQSGGVNNCFNLVIGSEPGSTGTFDLSGGSLNVAYLCGIGGDSLNPGGTGVLTVRGTGVLTAAATVEIVNTKGNGVVNLSGGTINAAALNFNGQPARFNWTSGTLNITSNVTWDGAAGGTTTAGAFGPDLTLAANQTLMVTGNETLGGAGTFNLVIDTGSTHYVTGTLTVSPTGTITQNAGSTLFAATFTQAGGTVNGTLQNQGVFNYQNGLFNGRLLNFGSVNVSSNFIAGNGVENGTSITLAAGQTLTANGAGLDNLGLLVLNSSTVAGDGPVTNEFGATIQGHGTINPPVSNYGTLSASGVLAAAGGTTNFGLVQGNGSISGAFSNDVTGTVAVAAGNSLAINSDWANPGLISLQGATARLGGGAIANSGSIQGLGLINSAVVNTGIIEALGGTLSFGGMLTNSAGGLLTAGVGSKLLVTPGLATNDGIINLTGGAFDNNGHPLDNTGEISGWGIFRTGGVGLDNHGNMTFSGGITTVNGPLTNEDGQTITVAHNPAIFTGLVTNNGGATFTVTDATATFAGGFTNNGASNFAKAGDGTIEITKPPILNNGSTLSVTSGTLRFNLKSSAATIGTGATAVVSSGATLELAGTVSALSSGANRVNITNNSTAPGVLVSGTHQRVGGIDGAGTTLINAGSDLTADHIIQDALVIGGTSTNPGLLTIDASDASGNPLASLVIPEAAAWDAQVGTGAEPGDSFAGDPIVGVPTTLASAVPEPSSLLLIAISGLSLAAWAALERARIWRREPLP